MIRIDPRDEATLFWFFNDAQGQLDERGNLHDALVRRMEFKAVKRPNHLNGLHESDIIYVGSMQPASRDPECPDEGNIGFRVAGAERRVREQLYAAGPEVAAILRLRFREVLPECRIPFGMEGKDGRTGAPKGRKLTLMAVRKPPRRGAGMVAHLSDAAREGHAAAVRRGSTMSLEAWTDQLGKKLDRGNATAAERLLGAQIAREALALVLWAWRCYRAARLGRRIAQGPSLAA